ncbi:hypothetical protein Fmac_031560 [Flemingia macrophylla]|uniref:VQ domain-containing protein n=1 Tax=Flemingia macrophylla TaxID=520843 RepID=A0ABD1L2E5_9FABA
MDEKKYEKQVKKVSNSISEEAAKHGFNKQENECEAQVYNISKKDFREMVQKLTGHTPPKPLPSSRLHRLRPPPLPQILRHRRPPPHAPPSPLPPFPSVHAESPVSTYMRFVRSSMEIPSSPVALADSACSMDPSFNFLSAHSYCYL